MGRRGGVIRREVQGTWELRKGLLHSPGGKEGFSRKGLWCVRKDKQLQRERTWSSGDCGGPEQEKQWGGGQETQWEGVGWLGRMAGDHSLVSL